ncbi:MAG: L-serine ammonia-lyase, iron-sulfur-dependent, subunit alpha [Lachnospiraceae bacterium]|nr:L-serine ammonia-lyase, iron-sulfur-dependent, subunit alpha [Lachnospiraceae bacterium]
MEKLFYPDFFNDVFGPIMQPGSSGAFAGTSRVGRVAGSLVRGKLEEVHFLFNQSDRGSFDRLGNMMEDRGYLGGALGFTTDDYRLFEAHEIAREQKISYDFKLSEMVNGYPGSITIRVKGRNREEGFLKGASVGGGMIRIYEINGYPLKWQSDTYGILVEVQDKKTIGRQKEAFEREQGDDHIQTLSLKKNGEEESSAYFIELSREPEEGDADRAFAGQRVTILPAVLPVVTTRQKRPQLFQTVAQWREVAEKKNISFVQAAIEYEKASSGWTEEEIWAYFEKIADIFEKQIHALERMGYENAKDTPLLPIYGKLWKKYLDTQKPISDTLTRHILTHAYAVNAKLPGVLIVPGPMGTGGGYLFSALDAVREERGYSHERLIESLVVAAGLGALAYTHTNASGEVGCVGESGVCCAMASGAVAWLAGGDGVAVERAAVTAPMYAEMALAGIDPLIPYHECLQAIERHFRAVPNALLRGSACGCNCTPTAERCRAFLKEQMADSLQHQA